MQLIYFHYVMEDVYYVRPLSLEYIRRYALRFMGKTVNMPHFNREHGRVRTRERDESKPGINTLLPFLKNVTKESDLENFQDLIVALDTCYWLHKAI